MDFQKIILARKAITDKHGEKKPQLTFQSVINCPVCMNGELHYQISAHRRTGRTTFHLIAHL